MEAIERSPNAIEFHRYSRRRIPVPVLPPKVPVTHNNLSKVLSFKSLNGLNDGTKPKQDEVQVQKIRNHSGGESLSTDSAAFPRDDGEDRKQRTFDYAEERDERRGNGEAFNLVDKKRVEEKNYCSALTTPTNASSSTNAFEENGIRTEPSPAVVGYLSAAPVAAPSNARGYGGGHRYSRDDYDYDDDDDECDRNRIRSCGVKRDYDRNPPVPQRTSKRVFLMEAQCSSRSTTALLARKIDLHTFSSDCLARNTDEGRCTVSNALDYRLRYGLSSLEISSKYLSNRDDELLSRNNGRVGGDYPASYASDGQFSYQTSTAATFFARYVSYPYLLISNIYA